MNHPSATAPAWQEAVFKVLKEGGVDQIAYVPDAGHSHVIRSAIADPDIEDVVLTTEEEGLGPPCSGGLARSSRLLSFTIPRMILHLWNFAYCFMAWHKVVRSCRSLPKRILTTQTKLTYLPLSSSN